MPLMWKSRALFSGIFYTKKNRFDTYCYLSTLMTVKNQFISFLLILFTANCLAQTNSKQLELNSKYTDALNLLDNQKYVAAQKLFEEVEHAIDVHGIAKENKEITLLKINAEYYAAVCGLELFNANAEKLLLQFVINYPDNPCSKLASFDIGNFYYRQLKYKEALEWYAKTDASNFSQSQRTEFNFKNGYANYEEEKYEQASTFFKKIKSTNSKYTYPAIYYEALVNYELKKYKEALAGFAKLKDSKVYAEIIPYYIVKINYDLKKYNELLAYTAEIIKQSKLKNEKEILLLSASAAFLIQKYDVASNYYELAANKTSLKDQEVYELSYSYFQQKKYFETTNSIKPIADHSSIYAQHGLYLMGESFVLLNDKQSARNAFWKASKLKLDEKVKEESFFNYGKLSFELQFNQTAIETLRDYLKQYKKSENTAEAKSLLGDALLSTKNYKDAIKILDDIEDRTPSANLALQKVTYFRAIELVNNNEYKEAIQLFNRSSSINSDKILLALAQYWRAECYYQLNDYENALKNFSLFSQSSSATGIDLFNTVNYQLGYTYFKMEDFKSSVFYFDKYLKGEDKQVNADKRKVNDATLRLADGYFMIKDYDKALFSYQKISNEKAAGTDYALFQKGMILGLQSKQNDKIVTLKQVLTGYPKSTYADDAYYEIANSYFSMNNTVDAAINFNNLINLYANSRYVAKSKLSLGLIYYNDEKDAQALAAYKSIIIDYPGTEEAKEALLAIKNIYVDAGNADEYLSYIKTLPFASVSAGAQDSISYQSANSRYLRNDCDNAIVGFNSYLDKFPTGYFSTESHVNRAECLLKTKQEKRALEDFVYLIDNNKSKYIERSLLMAGRISMNQNDYQKASKYYTQLETVAEYKENYAEAIANVMKSSMMLNDTASTLTYANKVLAYEKSATEDLNTAHLFIGKINYASKNIDKASEEFAIVIKNTKTILGAEAKYYAAMILFDKGNYLDAQKACFELSNQIPSYEYWVAKGFILLADTYQKLGNDFQAKTTLQSIIDEYEGKDEIIPTAKKKLEEYAIPKQ